jgi:PhzF family phenazine biosynthesis protein
MPAVPVRIYASFPAKDFGGNIAGVVYDEVGLGRVEMQRIAAELGAPTTGFVRERDSETFDVRFFSTRSEMGMCGHVTIGIFASLFDDKKIAQSAGEYRQLTPIGEIAVSVAQEDNAAYVAMRQLPPKFDLIHATAVEIAPLLGISGEQVCSIGASSTALSHLFVELKDETALASIHPHDDALRTFSKAKAIDTIGVWCFQHSSPAGERVRLRDLCHGVGDPEEAASGTTNGALACLLWKRGRAKVDDLGYVRVTTEQGFEMGRPSLISSQVLTDSERVIEVKVGGRAKRRLEGNFFL